LRGAGTEWLKLTKISFVNFYNALPSCIQHTELTPTHSLPEDNYISGAETEDGSSAHSGSFAPFSATNSATTPSGTERQTRSFGSARPTKEDEKKRSFRRTCTMIWGKISDHRYGNVFSRPLKEDSKTPKYFDIVKKPMNMASIKNRIKNEVMYYFSLSSP
jgi:hypothetical protein